MRRFLESRGFRALTFVWFLGSYACLEMELQQPWETVAAVIFLLSILLHFLGSILAHAPSCRTPEGPGKVVR